ncbi:MAG: GNAT family N-acetyltransferase [Chitinophagales bacterium]
MNQPTIRTATLNDLPTLLQFEQGVIEAERPYDVTLKEEKIYYYNIEEFITASHIELLVAELDGQLIGSGYARMREETASKFKHQEYAYLGFMYVLPEFRGRGVNGMILEELKKWCKTQNLTELRLQVYHDNPNAIRAYEKAGFAKLMVSMRMKIEE